MFNIACDSCSKELESGFGRPASTQRRLALCDACGAVEAAASAEIRKLGTVRALALYEELQAKKAELIREMTPAKPGDAAPRRGLADFPPIQVRA